MSTLKGIAQRLNSAFAREVVSDVLITIGAMVLFFCLWYVWLGDVVAGAQQDSAATSLSQSWDIPTTGVTEFDREIGGVLGVAIENHNLRPGESTAVYVIRQGA
jgi:hypothetical protein